MKLPAFLTRLIRGPSELELAERKRALVKSEIAVRRKKHREWKPLMSDLRRATRASLEASAGKQFVGRR